ncbi:TIR domain-containing protein [Sphingomicrobium nitratireducens]|uniref:TIR domain-containing protein n=1 Tax=Sphingomicrobium nitratireducens TaxID=2964666 RepID=UPI002240CF8B|nr:TIR domain-containing protein [Sphingomicrobium nitratireducens]
MADIFLSYARADQPLVEKLAAALLEAGYSVWWDRHIQGGQEFSKDIEQAMEASKAVVVAWSASSVDSEWVRDEAAYGRDENKLVPIRIENTMPPLGFRQRQAIDFSGGRFEGEPLAELFAVLDAKIGGETHEAPPAPVHRKPVLLAAIAVAILAALIASWWTVREGADASPVVAVEARSLLVLPFVATSRGEDDQYFADGLTEEVLNRLDALDELRVVPRTTAFTYRDTDKSIEEIGREMGVGHIVEGSLRREGDQVRVTARLVEASGERTLWSENYDASVEDVFKVQADISEKVADALDVLLDEEKRRAMAEVGIDNPEAFALYAKGQEKFDEAHRNLEDMRLFAQVVDIFDQAYAMEPKLARAQILAADFHSHILIDEAGGLAHPELPDSLRSSARDDLDRRLRLAQAKAGSEADRLAIELFRLAFSDDWSRIPELSKRFYSLRGRCASSAWPGFGFMPYGGAPPMFEFYDDQYGCHGSARSYWGYVVMSGVQAGELDRVERIIAKGREDGVAEREFLEVDFLLALARGDRDRAIDVAMSSGASEATIAIARKDSALVPTADELQRKRAPYKALQTLAQVGYQKEADDLAAAIDARPAGASVLEIVVDECLCGAPFDISRTPNFAARLEELGATWPPKSPIKWPLKKERR